MFKQLVVLVLSILLLHATTASASGQSTKKSTKPLPRLVRAIIDKESSGGKNQHGDLLLKNKAYGPMQIRQLCVDDVNDKFGTKYRAEDCVNNLKLSLWIYDRYMELYATKKRLGRKPTDEDRARIWNGGPNGHKSPSTKGYWRDVKKRMKS